MAPIGGDRFLLVLLVLVATTSVACPASSPFYACLANDANRCACGRIAFDVSGLVSANWFRLTELSSWAGHMAGEVEFSLNVPNINCLRLFFFFPFREGLLETGMF